MSTGSNQSGTALSVVRDQPWTFRNGERIETTEHAIRRVDTAPYRRGVRKAFDDLFCQLDEQNSHIAALLVTPSGRT